MRKALLISLLFFLTALFPDRISGQFSLDAGKSAFDGVVKTFHLKNGRSHIGYVVQMDRSSGKIRANYLPQAGNYSTDLVERFVREAANKNVFLASVGAYSYSLSGTGKPVGLCIDDGELVNSDVDAEMDALVIVEAVGGVRVSNIDEGNLNVRMDDGTYRTINLKDAYDKRLFVNWANGNGATVFQSHLLAYKGRNLVNAGRSNQLESNRRVLILTQDRNGTIYHSLLYTKYESFSLYDLTRNTLSLYSDQEVIAIVNLDAGACDYFETSDAVTDRNNQRIQGTSSVEQATNIIYYEYVPY